MKFRTISSGRQRHTSPSGSRYRKKYIKSYSTDGAPTLLEDGLEDVYDSIQKAAPGNIIEDLLRRAKSGDTSAIREPVDSFADLSNAPTDLLSAHQMLVSAKDKYLGLPAELRARYGNSFEKFLTAASDGSLISDLQQPNKKAASSDVLNAEEITKLRSLIGGTKDE